MIDYSRYQDILITRDGNIATLTLNRPAILNAVGDQMLKELSWVFADMMMDDEVDVVILTGAGRGFCSGGERGKSTETVPSSIKETVWRSAKLINDILDLDKPLIAAVNGPAVGLGTTLALFSDIIIASDTARFGDPHVRVAVAAGDGCAIILPLLVGVAKAKELLLTGDIIDAPEAERIGLVNKVVPHDELMPAVMGFATRLANGPLIAQRWTKRLINKRLKQDANLLLDVGLAMEDLCRLTEDRKELGKAWAEKREPRYQGR